MVRFGGWALSSVYIHLDAPGAFFRINWHRFSRGWIRRLFRIRDLRSMRRKLVDVGFAWSVDFAALAT